MFKVMLRGEDGDYFLAEFSTYAGAMNYCVQNESRYGEGQSLYID